MQVVVVVYVGVEGAEAPVLDEQALEVADQGRGVPSQLVQGPQELRQGPLAQEHLRGEYEERPELNHHDALEDVVLDLVETH